MKKIHILHIIFFGMIIIASAYNDTGMFRDGFKLNPNGNDINLENRTVWNGTFNGTFVGVQTGSDNSKVNKSGDNWTGDMNAGLKNITNLTGTYQEYSKINMTITNNCEDVTPGDKYCPRTLQELSTNYSNVTIRHRLNSANNGYGIVENLKPDGALDNPYVTGWGIFVRPNNDDFYVGRYTGYGTALAEFIWRCQNNASCTFYNHLTVTKNITVSGLAGSGNAPTITDSTGKLYVNRTAGAGIPITSPDGTARCLKVSDAGTITANSGVC